MRTRLEDRRKFVVGLTLLTLAAPPTWAQGARALALGPNGEVVVAGQSRTDIDDSDLLTIVYDSDGALIWADAVDGPVHGNDFANDVAIADGGDVVVTGALFDVGFLFRWATTIRYAPDGELLWQNDYAAEFAGATGATGEAVAVDGLGRVFVAGSSNNDPEENDVLTLLYDADGSELWSNEGGQGGDVGRALVLDEDDSVYVAGRRRVPGGGGFFGEDTMEYGMRAYDVAGSQLWSTAYSGSGSGSDIDEAHDIAIDAYGDLWVTGTSCTTDDCFGDPSGPATVQLGPNGNEQWAARLDTDGGGEGRAVAIDDDGNGYVAGSSDGDMIVIKYDFLGNELWTAPLGDGVATAVVPGPVDTVYVTGESDGDYLTVQLTFDGWVLSTATYDSPAGGDDRPTDIALDGDGNVYVTGESDGRFATIKYSSALEEQWVRRSGGYGPPPDFPLGIEIPSPDGWWWTTETNLGAIVRVHPVTGFRDVLSGCVFRRQSACEEWVGPGPELVAPRALAAGPSGEVYVLDGEGRETTVRHVDGASGAREIVSGCVPGSGCSERIGSGIALASPQGIAVEADGSILVTDLVLDAVLRIDPGTGDRTVVSGCSRTACEIDPVGTGPSMRLPAGIAVEKEGQLALVDVQRRGVLRIDPMSGDRTLVSADSRGSGPAFGLPVDLAVEKDGGLVVLDASRPTRPGLRALVRVDPTDGSRRIVSDDTTGRGESLKQPEAIAVTEDGELLVVDSQIPALFRIDPNSGDRVIVEAP